MLLETNNQAQVQEGGSAEVKQAVLASTPSNPALQRLQARVRAGAETGEMITSYDRMHHRHSRS